MKIDKTKLIIGVIILSLGIILVAPVIADTEDESLPELYYFDEETGEYKPLYPRWYDPENPDSFTAPEDCPWWDSNGDGEFDWMPHWGRRWNNPEDGEGYGHRRGGCGGYGYQSNDGKRPN